jgi:pimeloyl-ACP methyl ester carboxylesterase
MPWPHPPDYNEAIQNPQLCFADPELRVGEPALNPLGLPWPRSGNSADVYKIICPNDQIWAVKCFTREVRGLRERYQAVSDFLARRRMPFMVEVHYLEQGIRVRGQWFPVVKMRWVDGLQLNDLAREFADKPAILDRLGCMWVRLAQEMRKYKIVHGDLQHGNVLLVPEDREGHLRLRLVDYDGLTVPALEKIPSGEVGHPNYQHPQRLREGGGGAEADRFANLVIYTAVRALRSGGQALWERFDNSENLLFRETDFQAPANSALFRALMEMDDPEVRSLAGQLLIASQGKLMYVPLLQELVSGAGRVLPLTERQQQKVDRILAGDSKATITGDLPVLPLVDDDPLADLANGTQLDSPRSWLDAFAQWTKRLQERTHWSNRALLTAGAGIGTILALLVISLVLWLIGLSAGQATEDGKESRAPVVVQEPPPATTPEPLRPRLQVPPAVTVKIGKKQEVRISIERQGRSGDLALRLYGLPDGIRYDYAVPVDDPASVRLQLDATQASSPGTWKVDVQASVGDAVAEPQPLALTVAKTYAPRLVAFPDVALGPGEERTVKVAVAEVDPQDPVEPVLDGMPATVKWKVSQIRTESDQYTLWLTFTAAADAEPSITSVEGAAKVGEQTTDRRTFTVTVLRTPSKQPADKPEVQKVAFHTADGVTLVGSWYPGAKGQDSPCAMLLHEARESRRVPGWDGLARALQDKGFAVLAFDFRGHGDSSAVARTFWDEPTNRTLVRGRVGDTVSFKGFDDRYWPVLVNDIAAARMFLDQKNDLKECNASRVVLIGAQEGAALGVLWLAAEWSRYEVIPGALTRLPEGKTVTGVVCLSLGPTLLGRASKVPDCLQIVAGDRKLPVAMLFSGDDAGSADFARQTLRDLRLRMGNPGLTGLRSIPGTRGMGHHLLQGGETADKIILHQVVTFDEQSTARWAARESDKKAYIWQVPRSTPLKAKSESDKTIGMIPLIPLGLTQ